MSPDQMEFRCPDAVPMGIGTLDGYRFIINNRGVASITPEEGTTVYGVLWSISEEHEKTLDVYEGVDTGFYCKENVSIQTGPDNLIEALVYIASESKPGSPREGYLEKILFGARHFELPKDIISELESWSG